MPTEPVHPIISWGHNPEAQEALDLFSSTLVEAVNFGSHVQVWCQATVSGSLAEAVPVMFFRHFLGLLDSVSVLVRHGCIDPSSLILRGMLESYFGLRYMLAKDTHQRATSLMVCLDQETLKGIKKMDPSTEVGKRLRNRLAADEALGHMTLPEIPDLHMKIQGFTDRLADKKYATTVQEYERLRKGKGKTSGCCQDRKKKQASPNWFSLFGGPSNIQELAQEVGCSGLYELLYRRWSGAIHGTDVLSGKIVPDGAGQSAIVQLRSTREAQFATNMGLVMATGVFKLFVRHYVPDREEQFQRWFVAEMAVPLREMSSREILQSKLTFVKTCPVTP